MSKTWNILIDQEIQYEPTIFQFWNGVDVWIERPHLVNRKLLATELIQKVPLSNFVKNLNEIFNCFATDTETGQEFYQYLIETYFDGKFPNIDLKGEEIVLLILRNLIPRNSKKFSHVLEAVLRDENKNEVTFWPKRSDVLSSAITPSFPYKIQLCDNRIIIQTYRSNSETSPTIEASENWLKKSVLPKIIKWCCCSPKTAALPSLNLISAKNYSSIYNNLKEKYGKKYVEIWPECSDPLKYVYEDIAIAAYLMTLWEKEREDLNLSSKQTFVDLGCGNGLLVDILASEGYVGIGIDVRKRKIWDLYKTHTTLIEKTIEPSAHHLFPNYDWIIGNHSDELTPWIPVIAARSSYKTRVFLLPCCAYTFNGKYERCKQGQTQYQSYLSFIYLLCESMGFVVQKDKLRIPSTKRTCLICSSRNYQEEDEQTVDVHRDDFIKTNSRKTKNISKPSCDKLVNDNYNEQELAIKMERSSENMNWIQDFKPREQVEIIQNCSQLDREFLENTVLVVAKILLGKENYISLQRGSEKILWNSGDKIKLGDLIKLMDPSILKGMKNQCGGFQTFIRNHRNVFQIIDGDVQLTVPIKGIPLNSNPAAKAKRRRVKQYNFREKPCFFHFHHPQGCPLEAIDYGSTAQYENESYIIMCFPKEDFNIEAEWYFSATAHGKGPCDGVGGTVKRLAARRSLQRPYESQIMTPIQLYQWAEKNIPFVNFLFVTQDEYSDTEKFLANRLSKSITIHFSYAEGIK